MPPQEVTVMLQICTLLPCVPCCRRLQKESVMVLIAVLCPHCHSDHVIKGGKTKAGQQRYKCQSTGCPRYSFQRDLLYKG